MARKKYKPEEVVAKLRQGMFWGRRAGQWPTRVLDPSDTVHVLPVAYTSTGVSTVL